MKPRKPAAQRGVFAILFAVLLVVILALAGLAIDIGFAYERHGDMKNYANVAALAAAHQLDGTADGVGNAVDAAEDSVDDNTWGSDQAAEWDESALSFGPSADGPWISADAVVGLPDDEIILYRYARVDAGLLDATMATVVRYFPFGAEPEARLASVVSVAGPVMTQMMPLAVCAMNNNPHGQRPVKDSSLVELVEHGFRRGVTYNLLGLNPEMGSTVAASFLINPVDFPDSGSGLDVANFTHAAVAPFVCAGSITQPKSNRIYVQQPFPTNLIPEINSRLGLSSSCAATAALPDRNVKRFFDPSWIPDYSPLHAYAAKSDIPGGPMQTVADVEYVDPDPSDGIPPPTLPDANKYGTLWAYAKPVRYDPSKPDRVGTAFTKTYFKNLYPAVPDLVNDWPTLNAVLPYLSSSGSTYQSPSGNSLRYRRLMHIPLLQCPVTSNTATIVAVGKFLLSSEADDDPMNPSISAEFGGLVSGWTKSSDTRLFQ